MKKLYTLLVLLLLFTVNCIAGSDEVKLISLYPVPVISNTLYVKINISGSGVSKVELRNLIGKKIQEKQFPSNAGEVFFDNLDVNPDGVYVVVAKDAGGKILEISKFIINR